MRKPKNEYTSLYRDDHGHIRSRSIICGSCGYKNGTEYADHPQGNEDRYWPRNGEKRGDGHRLEPGRCLKCNHRLADKIKPEVKLTTGPDDLAIKHEALLRTAFVEEKESEVTRAIADQKAKDNVLASTGRSFPAWPAIDHCRMMAELGFAKAGAIFYRLLKVFGDVTGARWHAESKINSIKIEGQWHGLPSWANWIAINKSGSIGVFNSKPTYYPEFSEWREARQFPPYRILDESDKCASLVYVSEMLVDSAPETLCALDTNLVDHPEYCEIVKMLGGKESGEPKCSFSIEDDKGSITGTGTASCSVSDGVATFSDLRIDEEKPKPKSIIPDTSKPLPPLPVGRYMKPLYDIPAPTVAPVQFEGFYSRKSKELKLNGGADPEAHRRVAEVQRMVDRLVKVLGDDTCISYNQDGITHFTPPSMRTVTVPESGYWFGFEWSGRAFISPEKPIVSQVNMGRWYMKFIGSCQEIGQSFAHALGDKTPDQTICQLKIVKK